MNIKDIVKGNRVHFLRYRQGYFYYIVHVASEKAWYSFTVPLDDIGDATLENEDKAIRFMRYIRKAMENDTFIIYSSYEK